MKMGSNPSTPPSTPCPGVVGASGGDKSTSVDEMVHLPDLPCVSSDVMDVNSIDRQGTAPGFGRGGGNKLAATLVI